MENAHTPFLRGRGTVRYRAELSVNVGFKFSKAWGHTVVGQLVEALRYKPEGCGFDFRSCHWIFSLTLSFRPHYDPGVDSASNRNEYQEYFLGVKAAGVWV
jgi:hypothetical protein